MFSIHLSRLRARGPYCPYTLNLVWAYALPSPYKQTKTQQTDTNINRALSLIPFQGTLCDSRCSDSTFGQQCAQDCHCPPTGHTCHHVTGECLPCRPGQFGANCAENCDCNKNGTTLCFNENGNCYCEPNFYGRRCEMYCPFGYKDGVCHSTAARNGSCSCPSDLYRYS